MTLEVTEKEINRLHKHVSLAEKREYRNPRKLSPEKENKIAELVQAGFSNCEIKRCETVGDETINKIKRERGLWGR